MFIGFTGTPIGLINKRTGAVFGACISIYDIQRAVEGQATVLICCESRLAWLGCFEHNLGIIHGERNKVFIPV